MKKKQKHNTSLKTSITYTDIQKKEQKIRYWGKIKNAWLTLSERCSFLPLLALAAPTNEVRTVVMSSDPSYLRMLSYWTKNKWKIRKQNKYKNICHKKWKWNQLKEAYTNVREKVMPPRLAWVLIFEQLSAETRDNEVISVTTCHKCLSQRYETIVDSMIHKGIIPANKKT